MNKTEFIRKFLNENKYHLGRDLSQHKNVFVLFRKGEIFKRMKSKNINDASIEAFNLIRMIIKKNIQVEIYPDPDARLNRRKHG